ncbi:MAG: hypothetical protein ABI616_06285 [Pseudomonadota bacterium]
MNTRVALPLLILLCGCTSQAARPTPSSYGCMKAQRDVLPTDMPDEQKHCVASGLIARHCSVTEANMAGLGKELQDMFTGGDASWADWKMDRQGMSCAHDAADDAAVVQCCATAASTH